MIHKHYDFEIAMGATISDAIVKEMVTSIVEKQTGKKVKTIDLVYDESKFAGYSVTFYHDVMQAKRFKPSREFIVETYGAEE